ncbi:hypothetical protein [Polyangium fumosum]|uniref:Uncharacterized protein n=1 Tax=Polyangium fumosum TaxID=889272 RepID=A0A4U1JIM7_9BACT|nr:hypothetical protein [Polyangium fumosum]TKD12364.1 hypothetical protein E8A74_04495 [Polyangium fumosum]
MYNVVVKLDARLHNLIDDRLFEAYWAAVEHFGTTDLVLYFDTEVEVDPVTAYVRERLLADPSAPKFLAEKVSKPAKDTAVELKSGSTAFWLIVSFPDETIITAVNAQRLGEGGAA